VTLPDVAAFISQIGFPVFVAIYLLIRFDTQLRDNTIVLRDLKSFLESRTTPKE